MNVFLLVLLVESNVRCKKKSLVSEFLLLHLWKNRIAYKQTETTQPLEPYLGSFKFEDHPSWFAKLLRSQ